MQKGNSSNDWNDREKAEMIQLSILKLAEMLNSLETGVMNKMSVLNERIDSLERTLSYFENTLSPTSS